MKYYRICVWAILLFALCMAIGMCSYNSRLEQEKECAQFRARNSLLLSELNVFLNELFSPRDLYLQSEIFTWKQKHMHLLNQANIVEITVKSKYQEKDVHILNKLGVWQYGKYGKKRVVEFDIGDKMINYARFWEIAKSNHSDSVSAGCVQVECREFSAKQFILMEKIAGRDLEIVFRQVQKPISEIENRTL